MQIWHAGLLAVVLSGFGVASYYGIRQSRFQKIDADLSQKVQMLAARAMWQARWRGPGGGPGNGFGGGPGGFGGGPGSGFGGGPGGPGGGFGGGPGSGFGGTQGGPGGTFGSGPGGGFGGGPGGPGSNSFGAGPNPFPSSQPATSRPINPADMNPDGQPDFSPGGRGGRGPQNGGGPDRQGRIPDRRGGPRQLVVSEVQFPNSVLNQFGENSAEQLYFAVWTNEGTLIRTSEPGTSIPNPNAGVVIQVPPPGGGQADPPHLHQRAEFREAYLRGPFGTTLLVGRSIAADWTELHRSAWLIVAFGAGVLLVGLVGGWRLSVRAVRPIRAITAVAQEISATNLSRRIDQAGTSSELGTLAAVLNDTFARLEGAFSQQVRFTADASHELRTPLTVIHTNVQLALARDRTADEYRTMFQSCQRASERMKGLLDSLLLLARADAGSLAMNATEDDLQRIADECVSLLTPLAASKNITVKTQLQPVKLKADASRIGQVVTNLLTNAIRYNRDGGSIVVTVADGGDHALLSIADTGIGIPPENQPYLFERFYRVDFSRARDDGGTGLGLAICKTIVEAHGGAITFVSEPGKGTTFTVRLPKSIN